MNDEKILMSEVATLYYRNNKTQQEIAEIMHLSRQTVSKILNDAIQEKVVEIIIHDPKKDCEALEEEICRRYDIQKSVVCRVTGRNTEMHQLMAVKAAVDYVLPILQKGGLKIGVSWGRTIQSFIQNLPETTTAGNTVFPLFGATDNEKAYFSSNELARNMAGKIGADLKCAWFPYLTDSREECALLRQFSYYQKMQEMWESSDLVIIGIGNTEILDIFGRTFGYSEIHAQAVGDIATHFFNEKGEFVNLYENTLCASVNSIKNAGESIAIASGANKAEAIAGALRTRLIDTLITDEHTAKQLLALS